MRGCRPFTDEEVRTIAASFEGKFAKRDRALFLLGVRSGFRISELRSIRIQGVRQGTTVVDFVTVAREQTKGKREGRTVPLHAEAKAALESWLLEFDPFCRRNPETFVFQSRQGGNKPITRVRVKQILSGICQANGMSGPLGTHAMRKTFAKKVFERSGRDLLQTQQALGHRSISSTASYLDSTRDEINALILGVI